MERSRSSSVPAIAVGCLLMLLFAVGSAAASELHEREAEWSARLLHAKAVLERAQQRFDALEARYAKARVRGDARERVSALQEERDAAARELDLAREALPKLLERARAEGVGEEVLRPYRYATAPAAGG